MPDDLATELDDRALVHQFKNHLAVVLGFCDLLLDEMPKADARRSDLAEIRTAAQSALNLLPEVTRRLK
jgi:hypothetical protein